MRKDEMLKNNEFGRLLESLQVRRGWTQEDAVAHLGFVRHTYSDWVTGKRLPSPEQLKHIAATFKLSPAEKDEFYRAAAQVAPQIHNPPFPPNPFFTGREDELKRLGEALAENSSVALMQPVSLSGLGGIGKTQTALAYAYKSFPHVYRAILWVNAASEETLQASYDDLAQRLGLPEKQEHDAKLRIQAVKDWFATHTNWLLIMDNADDLSLARSFFPPTTKGHILLTTRSQFAGDIGARLLEIDKMTAADGLLFLLRRSHPAIPEMTPDTATPEVKQAAIELVELLDGHPLALDQAGAFVAETKVPIATYIELYKSNRRELLERRRAVKSEYGDHPDSVVVTFEISFEKAAEQHPLAADILRFCAFLQPDAIPEELFQYDDAFKAQPLAFHEGIAALWRYSLLKQNAGEKTHSMHRLVQAVLIDDMDSKLHEYWRPRVIRALRISFPEVAFAVWSQCERLIPHVLACADWTAGDLTSTFAFASLCHEAGIYLRERGRYAEAERLLAYVPPVYMQHFGMKHLYTARALTDVARLYVEQRKYSQAETLFLQILAIQHEVLGATHPDTIMSLRNLASIDIQQDKLEQAEPLLKRAVSMQEIYLGTDHPDTAKGFHNLAILYGRQGKYEEAESLYRRVLHILEKQLGDDHPDVAPTLYQLAIVIHKQGKDEESAILFRRANSVAERHLGANHPYSIIFKKEYARHLRSMGRHAEADGLETADEPPPTP